MTEGERTHERINDQIELFHSPYGKRQHSTALLTATMVLADKAELYQWYSSAFIFMAAIVIYAGVGIGMIIAVMRYLKDMDEMQRKIQLMRWPYPWESG
jgi:hypothetical protein